MLQLFKFQSYPGIFLILRLSSWSQVATMKHLCALTLWMMQSYSLRLINCTIFFVLIYHRHKYPCVSTAAFQISDLLQLWIEISKLLVQKWFYFNASRNFGPNFSSSAITQSDIHGMPRMSDKKYWKSCESFINLSNSVWIHV